jgi:hypothetical protein
MEHTYTYFDVNALPVHLFVKSKKDAKRAAVRLEASRLEAMIYRKVGNFNLVVGSLLISPSRRRC